MEDFTNEFIELEEKRLISIVKKNENSKFGDFYNINSDLNVFFSKIEIDEDSNIKFGNYEYSDLIKMAYGYAIRQVMAGLYVQGLTTRLTYSQIQELFYQLQVTTNQSKDFQISANEQALELVCSYNEEFNNTNISALVMAVENNYDNRLDRSKFYEFHNVVPMLNVIKNKVMGTMPESKSEGVDEAIELVKILRALANPVDIMEYAKENNISL